MHANWDLLSIHPVIDYIQDGNYNLDIYVVKKPPTKKTILKGGDGTDAETLDVRGPQVTGKVKGVYCDRAYIINTRTIPEVLYQDKMV